MNRIWKEHKRKDSILFEGRPAPQTVSEDSLESGNGSPVATKTRAASVATDPVDLYALLDRLLMKKRKNNWYETEAQVEMSEQELRYVIYKAKDIFRKEPVLLSIDEAVNIAGDLHGQYKDLLRIFEKSGLPPDQRWLLLGDYVDRGANSIETIMLLLTLKVLYPDKIYLLRGNHESDVVNRVYGFYNECKWRFNVKIWRAFCDCFAWLPVAAIIQRRIFCVHGGLSPSLSFPDDVFEIERPCEVPDTGLFCDLLWSDPISGSKEEWEPNDRGVSYVFNEMAVKKFLKANNLDLICRAHQVVEHGYEFFAKRHLVTVFSAPNYCNEFDNAGGIMRVDNDLVCSFDIIPPLLNIKQLKSKK